MAGAVFGEVYLSLFVGQYLVKLNCHFSCQLHYLVKSNFQFYCQAPYLVNFGMIAGVRNVVYVCIQNARGKRERSPRLRGGLRTDGFKEQS